MGRVVILIYHKIITRLIGMLEVVPLAMMVMIIEPMDCGLKHFLKLRNFHGIPFSLGEYIFS